MIPKGLITMFYGYHKLHNSGPDKEILNSFYLYLLRIQTDKLKMC